MRSVFAAIALGMMTCGSAAASSFVVIGETQAPTPIGGAGSSVVILGEPGSSAPTIAALGRPVDTTVTYSVGDPRADDAPRAKTSAAMAAEEWAKITSVQSQSMVYFGEPDPSLFKVPEQEPQPEPKEQVATFDPHKLPMIMRGGIFGDLFITPETDEVAPMGSASETKRSRQEKAKEKVRIKTPPPPPPAAKKPERE